MSAVEITCRPGDGILRLSAQTVAALDELADRIADTLPAGTPWEVDLRVGHSTTDTVHLTARPATEPTPEEDAA